MANSRSANTFYIDTQYAASSDDLDTRNLAVACIVLTATAASGRIVLQDPDTKAIKVDLRIAASGDSENFIFTNSPILFPNGIRVLTLSNAVATCILV